MPADHIRGVILPEARDMGRLAIERLLASFKDIGEEARQVGERSWDAAEAWDDEVAHYSALTNLHQAVAVTPIS